MEPLLDSPVAARPDVDVASATGALESQRLRIHEQMEAQRRRLAAIQKELSEQISRLGQPKDAAFVGDLEGALNEARGDCEQLRARLAAQDTELAGLRLEAESQRQEAESLRQEGQSLRQEGQLRRQEGQSLAAENKQLGEELAQRPVAPSDAEVAEADRADAELQEEHENLKRRYQMALDDLKSERAQVAQLESRLSQGASGSSPAPLAAGLAAGSDWESQKRRLLASLEADFDEEREEDRHDRMSIEDAIRRTDAVIAAKDQEILQLQTLLDDQSASVGSMAVGAAAVAEILDKDEVVRQERQNLQALQEEWRDKLRHAEVEISVQRAKLARQQAELEERARRIEEQTRGASLDESGNQKEKLPTRGRWLRRLGLMTADEE